METMNINEGWENNNINWQIAARLKKIWELKWEAVYRYDDSPNCFKYMWRIIKVWLKAVWAEVWDIPDDSDYVYTVNLWDIAICEDFRTVLQQIQKEQWFDIEISDDISISDCEKLLWWDDNLPSIDKMIEDSGTTFKLWAKERVREEVQKFNKTWLAFFSFDVIGWEFSLIASNKYLKDMIINKDKNFYYEMVRVKTRITEDLPIKLQEYAEKWREKEKNEKEERDKNINNLKKDI